MSAEVHRLTGAGPIIEPEPSIIARLEELLDRARKGEFKGFGYIAVGHDDRTLESWVPGCAQSSHMVASVSRLWFAMMKADMSDA